MKKKSFAEALASGTYGAAGGGQIGATVGGVPGALVGGLLGAGLGAFGGYADANANAPADRLNMEEQDLNNQLLKSKVRTAKTADKGWDLFRGFLGNAFKSGQPSTFGGALKAYPGLGNQGTP